MLSAFLIGVGVMCAMNVILAILMVIADATISNYGPCKITINKDRQIIVEGGQNLLATLKDQQIFIPSACGGRGACGLCKIKIESGAGKASPTELPWLNTVEQDENIRLACQVKVKTDLSIIIPESLFSVHQFTARVTSIRDLTYDIKEIRLELINPREIDFTAGQYIQLEVPPYELTTETVYRAYSISSPPSLRHEIELEIRYVPNGICTTYVHKRLKIGDTVTLNGPYGDFFLRDTSHEIICVAGGSGMAPIKSILMSLAEQQSTRRIRYFFGARSTQDLFLVDEMNGLKKNLVNFDFIPALSMPRENEEWSGERGLVTEVVNRQVVNKLDESEAYLCGSPLMIDACVKVLREKGMPQDQIYFDKFA